MRLLIDGKVVQELTDNKYLTGRESGLFHSGAQIQARSFRVIAL